MTALRCVIFDVDGTLVDSQADILASMARAFDRVGAPVPPRPEVLSIVGLSLDIAMMRLAPACDPAEIARMVDTYKASYADLRRQAGAAEASPLYPGARSTLDRLQAQPETLLALATGKSRRGLDALLDSHGLMSLFVSRQVADHHPSKPHPSMLETILGETGVPASRAVMIGDTTFDMEMARAAGVRCIGVSWGYHPAGRLDADRIVTSFAEVIPAIDDLLEAGQ